MTELECPDIYETGRFCRSCDYCRSKEFTVDDVYIYDLFDLEALERIVEAGLVRVQTHPTEPLKIYNYTERCVYEQAWDEITLTCRGLIVDEKDRVVARGFRKFFNYGEGHAGELDLSAPAQVTDKMDGSLGVLYPVSDGWAVATRGSFASVQAIHATNVLRKRYPDVAPPAGVTVLVEIVFPANRIVCDYGTTDDLFLLGGVINSTGQVIGPRDIPSWPGPSTPVFDVATLADALAMPPRDGAEGLVVRMLGSGQQVKIKQADYLALHKIVTGLNARAVWEALGEGQTVEDICAPLPDELHPWVKDLAEELQETADNLLCATELLHELFLSKLSEEHPDGWERKHYAQYAVTSPHPAWLFNLLDERDPRPAIWKLLRPAGDLRPVNVSEDAA